jgi:hypothetical protein
MDNFLATLLYGHHNVLEGMHEGERIELTKYEPLDDGSATISTPITQFLAKVHSGLLAKSAGVEDESWDAPLEKTTASVDDPHRLEKGARRVVAGDPNDTRKIVRTEVTKYSDCMLIAELAETGEVVRVVEQAA